MLDAEVAHNLTLKTLRVLDRLGLLRLFNKAQPGEPSTVMGIEFPNPVGLSAGLDKNGEYIKALSHLGFGFIEIGTVTPRPQPGNPKPRIFRLPKAEGVINRLGFNNKGADYLMEQVKKSQFKGILGINIGKNKDTPMEESIKDYQYCLERVYPHASYVTINISSPNTPNLRELQYGDYLDELLSALKAQQKLLAEEHGKYVPIAIKIAPDLTKAEVKALAEAFLKHQIDGVIATNTTIARPESIQALPHGQEVGGLSGKPVFEKSTQVLAWFHEILQDQIPIIGVGGIHSAQDAAAKFAAGASLIQIYSGLIYRGPNLLND